MHPRELVVTTYLVPEILQGGAAVWVMGARSVGNDIRLEHEAAVLDHNERGTPGVEVVRALVDAGVPRRNIRFDDANERIPLPTETGNLIVSIPGTRPGSSRSAPEQNVPPAPHSTAARASGSASKARKDSAINDGLQCHVTVSTPGRTPFSATLDMPIPLERRRIMGA